MRLSRRTPASSETIIVLLKKTWDTERCGRDVAEFWPRWRAEMESRDGAEISRDQADVAEMSPPSCRAAAVAAFVFWASEHGSPHGPVLAK